MEDGADDQHNPEDVAAEQSNGIHEPAEKRGRMTKVERAALHAAQPHRNALLNSAPLLQKHPVTTVGNGATS